MSTYTEIIFGAFLHEDTPQDVIDDIAAMVDNHSLMNSNYGSFPEPPLPVFVKVGSQYSLTFRASVKNRAGEVEGFLEWIEPHVDMGSGEHAMYAIVTREDGEPQIYYAH